MIAAVSGIVMSVDEARIMLAELENRPDIAPNARVLAVRLRRVLSAETPGSEQHQVDRTPANARSEATSRTRQTNSAQHQRRESYTPTEAADALGITPNGVRDLRRRGVIRGKRIGGRWQLNAADIDHRARRKE